MAPLIPRYHFFSKLTNKSSTGKKRHFSGLLRRKIAPLELRALERPRSHQKFCRPIGQTKPPAALGGLQVMRAVIDVKKFAKKKDI